MITISWNSAPKTVFCIGFKSCKRVSLCASDRLEYSNKIPKLCFFNLSKELFLISIIVTTYTVGKYIMQSSARPRPHGGLLT